MEQAMAASGRAASPSRVLAARRRAGLSQEELAERTGLSVRSISNLERGAVERPRRASLEAIASALCLDQPARRELIDSFRSSTPGWSDYAAIDDDTDVLRSPSACPAQLPADNPTFSGRDDQLCQVDELVAQSARAMTIAVLHGIAGVGKSALALRWAHARRREFPDGQLYANLNGYGSTPPADPGVVLLNFIRALGVDLADIPASAQARAALFRSLLAGRRMIILLDDARNPAQIRPMLPGLPGCLVLVTSRSRMRGIGASHVVRRIALEPLTATEGTALLMRLTGAARVAAEPGAIIELLDCCAGIPLGLAIVAERICENPHRRPSAIAAELVDVRTRLDLLSAPDDEAARLRSVLSWSYDALCPSLKRIFRILAFHPGPSFGVDSAAAMLGLPVQEVRAELDQLVGVHMLEQREPARFEYHQLMRLYASEASTAADTPCERTEAVDRVRRFFLERAVLAGAGTLDNLDNGGGAIRTPVTGTVPHPGETGVLPTGGPAVERIRTLEDVAMQVVAWPGVDSDADGDGDGVSDERAGAAGSEASRIHSLGLLLRGIGRHHVAARCFEQASRTARCAGDVQLLARAQGELAMAQIRHGKVDDATRTLQAASHAAEKVGDRELQGYALATLGNTYRLLGRTTAARDCLDHAGRIATADERRALAAIVSGYLDELETRRS